jgi:hypothetical protein
LWKLGQKEQQQQKGHEIRRGCLREVEVKGGRGDKEE